MGGYPRTVASMGSLLKVKERTEGANAANTERTEKVCISRGGANSCRARGYGCMRSKNEMLFWFKVYRQRTDSVAVWDVVRRSLGRRSCDGWHLVYTVVSVECCFGCYRRIQLLRAV